VRAHRALTALVAVLLAVLPNTAQAAESYPDPLPLTGQQIIHDPAVIHLKSGGYAAYSTGGIIGARLSKDLRHWDDAGNAFAEPPSWWYEYNNTGDPWAPDISRRDGHMDQVSIWAGLIPIVFRAMHRRNWFAAVE